MHMPMVKISGCVFVIVVILLCGDAQGQELRLDAYPNCGKKLSETSTWSYISPTDHTVAGGGWFAWGCTDVIPGTLRSELEKIFPPVDAYLDFYVFDAANYQKFINGQASSCLCNELCFLQGTNGNMLPDPKIGRCELAQTTTVYHVMVNRGANAAVYYQFGSYFHYDGFLDSSSSSSSSSSSTSILSSSSLTSSSSTAQANGVTSVGPILMMYAYLMLAITIVVLISM